MKIVQQIKQFSTFLQRPGDGALRNVTMIPGCGIGPSLCEAVIAIFQTLKPPIKFNIINDFQATQEGIEQASKYPVIFKNNLFNKNDFHKYDKDNYSPNLILRNKLDVFAHVTHHFNLPGVKTRHQNIDIVIIRENLEGEYSCIEHEVVPGVVESLKIITAKNSQRIAQYAFEFAYLNERKKVTAVHKANIMKLCDGEFLKAVRQVASQYPDIKYNELIVDNASMQMSYKPQQFDVLVMPNLYGGILSNIATGLVGGPGVTAGASIGEKFAIFEPGTRHKGKDLVGKGIANPTGSILSACLMLRHLQFPHFGMKLQDALFKTLEDPQNHTPDLGGTATTDKVVNEVIKNLKK